MSSRLVRTLLAAVVAFAAAASTAQSQDPPVAFNLGLPEPDPDREWTLMVFHDGDNDLEEYALRDLNEMEAGLPDEAVEVVVLFDRAEGYDESEGNWTDARVFRVRPDDNPALIASEELARVGEINMGSPDTLSAFVTASIQRFPARQYGIILWDHGGGWRLMSLDYDVPGSEDGGDELDLAEVGQGLRAGLAGTGVEKFDIVGFDMCLMAQMETAYELREIADVLVASQAVEPGDGWPYSAILPAFGRGILGPRRLGAEIVDAYGDFYDKRGERVATLSAIDLSQIAPLNEALDSLVSDLNVEMSDYWSEISRSVFYSESYAERSDLRYEEEALSSVDLLDMLKRTRNAIPEFPAETAYRNVVALMDRAIIANYRSKSHRLSNGMAIYAPVSANLLNNAYYRTAFAQQTAWPEFLREMHEAQAVNLSRPIIKDLRVVDSQSGSPVAGGPPGGGFRLEATVVGQNVLWVEALDALWDDENQGYLVLSKGFIFDPEYYKKRVEAVADVVDLIMPEFRGESTVVSHEFQGRRFYVSNGETAALGTIDATDLSDLATGTTPVLLSRDGDEYFATVYFDLLTWQTYAVVAEIPQPEGGVTYRRIDPKPDDRVTLLFEFIPDATEGPDYLKGEAFSWGSGLELILGDDEPGEVVFAMRAESIGGISSFSGTSITVEPTNAVEQEYVDAARKLTPEELLGTWRWNGFIDGRWQPIPLKTEFEWWDQDPSVLVATTLSEDDPDFAAPGEAFLDTRLTPSLRIIRYDDDGYPSEMDAYSLKVVRQRNQPPLIQLKQLGGKGWLIRWTREGEAPQTPNAPEAPQGLGETGQDQSSGFLQNLPLPSPQLQAPQVAMSLAGIWEGPDGMMLAMDDTNYEFYIFGELVDMGSYQFDGRLMVTIDYYGDRYNYQVEGAVDWFSLTDEDGNRYVFSRLE